MSKVLSVHDLKDETPFDFIGNTANRIHDSKFNGAYDEYALANVVAIDGAIFNNARERNLLPNDSYGLPKKYIESNDKYFNSIENEDTNRKLFTRENKNLSVASATYKEEKNALKYNTQSIGEHHSIMSLRKRTK